MTANSVSSDNLNTEHVQAIICTTDDPAVGHLTQRYDCLGPTPQQRRNHGYCRPVIKDYQINCVVFVVPWEYMTMYLTNFILCSVEKSNSSKKGVKINAYPIFRKIFAHFISNTLQLLRNAWAMKPDLRCRRDSGGGGCWLQRGG